MAENYIPSSDGKFDDFQSHLFTTVDAKAKDWNIEQSALDEIKPLRERWDKAWAIAKIKKTRTPADVLEKDEARKAYEPAIRTFVKQWLAFNPKITDKERSEMGLTVPSGEHKPRPAIVTSPGVKLTPIGGGELSVECRSKGDKSLPSMHPDADMVEIKYKLGEPAPHDSEEVSENHNSTRSRFTMKLGDKNSGKRFYGFARWVNTSDSAKSGPWSPMFTVMVA